MSGEALQRRKFGSIVVGALLVVAVAACGGDDQERSLAERTADSKSFAMEETSTGERGGALAEAEIGPKEVTNMMPADGKDPDPAQPLPENPPEDAKIFPATTNRLVEGEIEYDRKPPTNGDHSTIWQNCGFYSEPIDDRTAVHGMDHGVVWITYSPDLPADQVETLRGYGDEEYVIVSPYPGLPAPVVVSAWRVQLRLDGAEDPRLRRFVDQFRVTEIAPLSGNRCVGGVGEPEIAP